MNLTTVDEDKLNPIFSCPDCDSEDINASPPPQCNDCGADGNQYDDMRQWIQCPECLERKVNVHGTPVHRNTNFIITCEFEDCEYEAELIWM